MTCAMGRRFAHPRRGRRSKRSRSDLRAWGWRVRRHHADFDPRRACSTYGLGVGRGISHNAAHPLRRHSSAGSGRRFDSPTACKAGRRCGCPRGLPDEGRLRPRFRAMRSASLTSLPASPGATMAWIDGYRVEACDGVAGADEEDAIARRTRRRRGRREPPRWPSRRAGESCAAIADRPENSPSRAPQGRQCQSFLRR